MSAASGLAMIYLTQQLLIMNVMCNNGANVTLLVAVDQVQNDSVIAAVERAIDNINDNNDTLPEYLLQYTTDKQVYTVQLYTWYDSL